MNPPELQAALEAVEAGDPEALAPLLWENPDLVHATLEHDERSTKLRPTLLHRSNCCTFAVFKGPAWTDGHAEVAQLLIDVGADIDSTVDGCMPPLEMAAWSRNPEMARILIDNGADVELFAEEPPVEVAVLYDRRDIFKMLIEVGASYDISHTLRLGMMPETRALLQADSSVANTETDQGLPLNLAVHKPGIFKLLLRHGADIHAVDSFGLTPLKAARIPESDAVVRTLLEMGVEDDIYGAIAAGDESKVEAFLKADASQAHAVSCWPDRGPLPPVIWAVWSGSTRILELILQQDVMLDFKPSPLTTAIYYHYDEMVRLLLEHGASPECEYPYDWPGSLVYPPYRPLCPREIPRADLRSLCAQNSLRLAARQCWSAMIDWLVSHGACIDTVDDEGKSLTDLVGKSDSRPGPHLRVATRHVLGELTDVWQSSPKARAAQLRDRAELLDAVIDGDTKGLDAVRRRAPGLFDRELVQHELLHYAAAWESGEIVEWLVMHGAPLTISAATALGWMGPVTDMLDADPDQLEGVLPLEETSKKRHLPWFEHTPLPLTIAAMHDRVDIVAMLLDRGAQLDRPVGWYRNRPCTMPSVGIRHGLCNCCWNVVPTCRSAAGTITIRRW